MRRWWRAGWANAASPDARRSKSTMRRARCASAAASFGAANTSRSTARAGEVIGGTGADRASPRCRRSSRKFMKWADQERGLGVRANADTPDDARGRARIRRRRNRALPHRAHVLRSRADRRGARNDHGGERRRNGRARSRRSSRCSARTSSESCERWPGKPVTIRLLDPPLHEFLPKDDEEIRELRRDIGADPERLKQMRDEPRSEFNPMLGHRGVAPRHQLPGNLPGAGPRDPRGGDAQLRAEGVKAIPEIMLPLIGERKEFDLLAARDSRGRARKSQAVTGNKLRYTIGTMIEVPRACIEAGSDRGGRRLLLLRHQRSDADDLRTVARRLGQSSSTTISRAASTKRIRSRNSTRTASAT